MGAHEMARAIRQAERDVGFHLKMIALHVEQMASALAEISRPFDSKDCCERPPQHLFDLRVKAENTVSAIWDNVLSAVSAVRCGETGTVAEHVKQVVEECELVIADAEAGNSLRAELLESQPSGKAVISPDPANPGSVRNRVRKAFGADGEGSTA